MPLITSLLLMRPRRLCSRSPARPHQLPFIASLSVGLFDDRRRPVEGVDLGDQRAVGEPGLVVELLVGPGRILGANPVCDRVVLHREEHVQRVEAVPHRSRHVRVVEVLLEILRQRAVRLDPEPAALSRSGPWRRTPRRARRSASCPTSACRPCSQVWAPPGSEVASRGVRRMIIGFSGQSSPSSRADLVRLFQVVRAVAEPVVDLELDPGGGEDVQRRRRDELVPRHQVAADLAHARRRESRLLLGERVLERDVAAEARAGGSPSRGSSRSLNVPSHVREVR